MLKDDIQHDLDAGIRREYLMKFRKEVDFHHKVAYRFERAYRLSKSQPNKKDLLNQEIIELISEHSSYIQQDPMAMFYLLYFCIYFNNKDLVTFLSALIIRIENRDKEAD